MALNKGEFTLLLAFLNTPICSLSREHLLQATWIYKDGFDVQIPRLRRKLDIDPSPASMIRTERSVGYGSALPVEQA